MGAGFRPLKLVVYVERGGSLATLDLEAGKGEGVRRCVEKVNDRKSQTARQRLPTGSLGVVLSRGDPFPLKFSGTTLRKECWGGELGSCMGK